MPCCHRRITPARERRHGSGVCKGDAGEYTIFIQTNAPLVREYMKAGKRQQAYSGYIRDCTGSCRPDARSMQKGT